MISIVRRFGAPVIEPAGKSARNAATVDTPSVSVFGPSDPARYFSGGTGAPGTRHVVVRHELWCAPCNLIRKPPAECAGADAPECLREVTPLLVYTAAARLLETTRGRA